MLRSMRDLSLIGVLVTASGGWLGGCSSGSDESADPHGGEAGTTSAPNGGSSNGSGGSVAVAGSGGTASGSGGAPASNGGVSNPSNGGAGLGGAAAGAGAGGNAARGGNGAGGEALGGSSSGGAGRGGMSSGGTAPGGAASGGATQGGSSAGGTKAAGGAQAAGGTGAGGSASGGAPVAGSGSGGAAGAGGSSNGVCPAGITQTINVAKDGSGQFTTVQAAINSIASGSSAHVRINIKAGSYNEKLTIASRTNLCLVGDSATSTILTYGDSNATVGSTSGSASVLISANDFSAANLTFQNSYGSGSQAVALRTTGLRQQFLNCRFVGYQDTLYTHSGSQYFKNCYVQGNTDYVFGGATAVLDGCEMRNVEGGSAVAAPNTDAATKYGIVFLGGSVTAVSSVKANSVGLARPWGAQGSATYLHVALGAHVIAAGFVPMSGNAPENARFGEYQSTGSGANASARSSYQLTATEAAAFTISNIFGGWVPSYSQ